MLDNSIMREVGQLFTHVIDALTHLCAGCPRSLHVPRSERNACIYYAIHDDNTAASASRRV